MKASDDSPRLSADGGTRGDPVAPPTVIAQRARVSRKVRAKKHVDTRTALIRLGTEMCTEKGFQVTGIEEVLKRAGVPKGSFYHFFASKREFGEAVIENYAQYFARKLDRVLSDPSRRPLERLVAFTQEAQQGVAKYQFRRGCLVGNLGQELGGLDDVFRHHLEAVLLSWQKRTAQCLAEAVRLGDLPAGADVDRLAEFFWIGWEGAILRAKLSRSTEPMQHFAEVFFAKVLT
jgi:TetR/AcrR family transcriptional repressor of nem operon